jgi:hypothetical protein
MPPDPWFAPKRYGYGAQPVTWQGWAVTLGTGLVVGLAVVMVPDPWRWLVVVPVASAYVAFSRARTSAPWRWRWGRE